MEINEFSNFYEAKENYLYQLETMFKKYNISLPVYMKKISEKDASKINDPKDEKELTAAIKCFEIISKSYEYADSRNISGYDNMVITFYSFLIKGLEDKSYNVIAQDYMNKIIADPILFGNYIVDNIIVDFDDLENDFNKLTKISNVMKIARKIELKKLLMLFKATRKERKKENSYLRERGKRLKGKIGAESYAECHDLVFGFLNEYENQQNMPDTFAMTYRKRNGL